MSNNDKLPNIIILIADEMRGDIIQNSQVKIPHIRSIGNDGVTFTNNFSVNPVCGPARCCMFTGQYPHNNGHRSLYQLLRPHEENLFKFLKRKGYWVHWIGRNDFLTKQSIPQSVNKRIKPIPHLVLKIFKKMIRKFIRKSSKKQLFIINQVIKELIDVFIRKTYPMVQSPLLRKLMEPYYKLNPYPFNHSLRKSFYYGARTKEQALDFDSIITDKTVNFIEKANSKQPFCLYLAFNFPHPPYTVEEPFFSMYNSEDIDDLIPPNIDKKPQFMKLMRKFYGLENLPEKNFKEIRATYYGMISRLDAQIGMILDHLKTHDLYDNSAIFFLVDHGDYAGDYGLSEKWPTGFEDCLLKVPLLIKLPNSTPKGKIYSEFTQSIDIFPTILELARIKTPYTHFGKSLIPLLIGTKDKIRNEVFAEGGYDSREPQCFEKSVVSENIPLMGIYYDKTQIPQKYPNSVCRSAMIRTKKWKVVIRSAEDAVEELYNLEDDPQELDNLIDNPEFTEVQTDLKNRLLDWYLKTSDNPHWYHKRDV